MQRVKRTIAVIALALMLTSMYSATVLADDLTQTEETTEDTVRIPVTIKHTI